MFVCLVCKATFQTWEECHRHLKESMHVLLLGMGTSEAELRRLCEKPVEIHQPLEIFSIPQPPLIGPSTKICTPAAAPSLEAPQPTPQEALPETLSRSTTPPPSQTPTPPIPEESGRASARVRESSRALGNVRRQLSQLSESATTKEGTRALENVRRRLQELQTSEAPTEESTTTKEGAKALENVKRQLQELQFSERTAERSTMMAYIKGYNDLKEGTDALKNVRRQLQELHPTEGERTPPEESTTTKEGARALENVRRQLQELQSSEGERALGNVRKHLEQLRFEKEQTYSNTCYQGPDQDQVTDRRVIWTDTLSSRDRKSLSRNDTQQPITHNHHHPTNHKMLTAADGSNYLENIRRQLQQLNEK